MKRVLWLSVLVLIGSILLPTKGACLWPFGGDNEANIEEIIQEYKQFEKSHDYSDNMLNKIKKGVKGKGKKNLTLRMAYMRLRYYRAKEDHDQSTIQEVSNEAESLLQGDHPLFRQQIRENEVKGFLMALKEARYNEKHTTSWKALIITCIVLILVFGIVLGSFSGEPGGFLLGAGLGLILGFPAYNLIGIKFFYKITIVYCGLPPVPFVG